MDGKFELKLGGDVAHEFGALFGIDNLIAFALPLALPLPLIIIVTVVPLATIVFCVDLSSLLYAMALVGSKEFRVGCPPLRARDGRKANVYI